MTEGLLASFTFTGNTNDSSSNGRNGTLLGGATVNGFLATGNNATDGLSLPASMVNGLTNFTFVAPVFFFLFFFLASATVAAAQDAPGNDPPRCEGEAVLAVLGRYSDDPVARQCLDTWSKPLTWRARPGVESDRRAVDWHQDENVQLLLVGDGPPADGNTERFLIAGFFVRARPAATSSAIALPGIMSVTPPKQVVVDTTSTLGLLVNPRGSVLLFERAWTTPNEPATDDPSSVRKEWIEHEVAVIEMSLLREFVEAWRAFADRSRPKEPLEDEDVATEADPDDASDVPDAPDTPDAPEADPTPAASVSKMPFRGGRYTGLVDANNLPHGFGEYDGKSKGRGVWNHGSPPPDAIFVVQDFMFYHFGTVDDTLRLHGMTTTWTRADPPGAAGVRAEGMWQHGMPVGTHVVRACHGCKVRRTAEFKDGVFVSGDYPWSTELFEQVEAERQWDLDAPERARQDSIRQVLVEQRRQQEEEQRRRDAQAENARRQEAERQARADEIRRRRQAELSSQLETRMTEFRSSARQQGIRITKTFKVRPDQTDYFIFKMRVEAGRRYTILVIAPSGAEHSALLELGGSDKLIGIPPEATLNCTSTRALCAFDGGRFDMTRTYDMYLTVSFNEWAFAMSPLYVVQYEN